MAMPISPRPPRTLYAAQALDAANAAASQQQQQQAAVPNAAPTDAYQKLPLRPQTMAERAADRANERAGRPPLPTAAAEHALPTGARVIA
jgi:hypothetical protein